MSCPACGHDLCQGDCPPNQPLCYEQCKVCGETEEYDDLDQEGICFDCILKGYTRDAIECHAYGCGVMLTEKEFHQGVPPFKRIEVRGLTITVCPACELKPAESLP